MHRYRPGFRALMVALVCPFALMLTQCGKKAGPPPVKRFATTGNLKERADTYLKDVLAVQAADFGKASANASTSDFLSVVGDVFMSGREHVVVFFQRNELDGAPGTVLYEKKEGKWVVVGTWSPSESGIKAMGAHSKVVPFTFRNLDGDKTREILMLEDVVKGVPHYQGLRYVKEKGTLEKILDNAGEPSWNPMNKEVVTLLERADSTNTTQGWKWVDDRLIPQWRSVQRAIGKAPNRELVQKLYRHEGEQWVLHRHGRGNLPYYANAAGMDIMVPLFKTGKISSRFCSAEATYTLTAVLQSEKIAAAKLRATGFFLQFSHGFFCDPDTFGPKFMIKLPNDEKKELSHFGEISVKKAPHASWKPPANSKACADHAKQVLAAILDEDPFSLLPLLPPEAPVSLPTGTFASPLKGKQGKLTTQMLSDCLSTIQTEYQQRAGDAKVEAGQAKSTIRFAVYPVKPSDPPAALACEYQKTGKDWTLTSLSFSWEQKKPAGGNPKP